ncbi:type II secretion system protein [Salmonella enterica]|nr:type II secretion system protein [Salmonella enterica subsp. enterica serovar Stanley]EDQ7955135.1 type II secretion system protein [Salmonella enterica subsp. enterica serovar Oslo]EGS9941590.1 type II secretion system protein [Salmonella enterica]EHG2547249.1 type II secretion system protein [Salmonella enterica]
MKYTSNRGSVLLEVIVVIAIIGMVMVAAANYARTEIDKAHRQNISDIVVTEISSFLSFVNKSELEIYELDSSGDPVKDAGTGEFKTRTIRNPLYDIPGKPGSLPESNRTWYRNRIVSLNDTDEIKNTGYIDWRNTNTANAHRPYFVDRSCAGSRLPVIKTSTRRFVEQFLSCDAKWENSEFDIDRVDLIGDQAKGSIERVDFFLAFNELTNDNGFDIFNYVSSLERAFDKAGYLVSGAYLINRNKGGLPQNWELIKNGSGTPPPGINVMKPDSYDFLNGLNKTRQYGIRLSMKPSGMNLKADGSINAEKLCWDPIKAGPVMCIASSRYSSDDHPMLSATVSPGGEPASLSVKELIFNNGMSSRPDGSTYTKYSTVPVIDYVNFSGENQNKIKVPDGYTANVNAEEGFISRSIQTCPLNPENGQVLYPRMAVALSSFTGESLANTSKTKLESELRRLKTNRANLKDISGDIDQIKAIVIQVNQSGGKWLISATTGLKNDLVGAYSVINPKSLSLLVTTWCATEEQDEFP